MKIYVTTSWDDGHSLDMKLYNLLEEYGLKGTFYITTDRPEQPILENRTKIKSNCYYFWNP